MQLTPVSEDLTRYLAAHGLGDGSAVWPGILRAIGVGPGEKLASDTNPVYGFYLQTLQADATGAAVLLFLVTGGRLLRYEWVKSGDGTRELVTTFPVDRVASVEEAVSGTTLSVAVFIDSPVAVNAGRAVTRTSPDSESADDDTVGTVEWTSRREGVTYQLTAAGDPGDRQKLVELSAFSRALRLLLGA